jgi:glycosyltransferase involved in cell wall biosynthesis
MTTQKPRAGVYDRWLHTLGGGEQAAVGFAQALYKNGYEVDLISHRPSSIEEIEQRLGTSLSGVTMRVIPFEYDFALGGLTKEYEVFVSNSYLDFIPNQSQIGIFSLFFPSKLEVHPLKKIWRSHVVPYLRSSLHYEVNSWGLHPNEEYNGTAVRWLKEQKANLTFNKDLKSLELEIVFSPFASSALEQLSFTFNDKEIPPTEKYFIGTTQRRVYRWDNLPRNTRVCNLQIPHDLPSKVGVVSWKTGTMGSHAYGFIKRFLPLVEARLHGGGSLTSTKIIESYDRVVVNSFFTQHWTQQYWKTPSTVLYPPVHIQRFSSDVKKKKQILHIGRFFVGGHNKKQLELITLFKKLVDRGVTDWEFHLVGGVAEGSQHSGYVDELKKASKGYPIVFHLNASSEELVEVANTSKLYWHGTGFGEKTMEPMNMEHFGLTTVEAMAAGCVPLVYNTGGQPEIVTAESGYLWNTGSELLEKTEYLINNPKILAEFSSAAHRRSLVFSFNAFLHSFTNILSELKEMKKL